MKCPICNVEMKYDSDRLDGYILLEEHYKCENCKKYRESYEYGNNIVLVGQKEFYWYYNDSDKLTCKISRRINLNIKFQKLLWIFKKYIKKMSKKCLKII